MSRKALKGCVLLWPFVVWAAHSSCGCNAEALGQNLAADRGCNFSHNGSLLHLLFATNVPCIPSWPHLESKSVFLCSEVCLFLVPFAWGQALFSIDVLRVYPNVQDLGVSARLSESGEKKKKEQDSLVKSKEWHHTDLKKHQLRCLWTPIDANVWTWQSHVATKHIHQWTDIPKHKSCLTWSKSAPLLQHEGAGSPNLMKASNAEKHKICDERQTTSGSAASSLAMPQCRHQWMEFKNKIIFLARDL